MKMEIIAEPMKDIMRIKILFLDTEKENKLQEIEKIKQK